MQDGTDHPLQTKKAQHITLATPRPQAMACKRLHPTHHLSGWHNTGVYNAAHTYTNVI